MKNVKDKKRALRRHHQQRVFRKRYKRWLEKNRYIYEWERTTEGLERKFTWRKEETFHWMKHTSTPCSCWMCSGHKRGPKPSEQRQRQGLNDSLAPDLDRGEEEYLYEEAMASYLGKCFFCGGTKMVTCWDSKNNYEEVLVPCDWCPDEESWKAQSQCNYDEDKITFSIEETENETKT